MQQSNEHNNSKEKDLSYWKKNAEEDYMKVPISVLRYIAELENVVLPHSQHDKQQEEKEIKMVCDKHDWQLISPSQSRCRKCGVVII